MACGAEVGGRREAPGPTAARWQAALERDLQEMERDPAAQAGRPSARLGWALTAVFGDARGSQAATFVRQRVGGFAPLGEVVGSSLDDPPVLWRDLHQSMAGEGARGGSGEGPPGAPVEAFNISSTVWILSQVQGRQAYLQTSTGRIDIDDPRQGLVLLPGDDLGAPPQSEPRRLTRWLRQSTLAHEARHGDCGGGGLSPTFVAEAARAPSLIALSRQRDLPRACGHWHAPCAQGDYRGLLVCDAEPWGAVAVGLLWLAAAGERDDLTRRERLALEVHLRDLRGRLAAFDVDALFAGELGPPDLSHAPRLQGGVARW